MYNELKNIMVLDKNFNNIGVLSNQGANPQAPYYDDLYIQELDTGADIYQFSAPSTAYTRSILVIGNHITFEYNNRQEMFTISSIELEHRNGYNTIGVYAEGIGFELLEIYIRKPKKTESDSGGNDSDNDGDDNFDDEYGDPDNVMIDEDGNIIYIPDKEPSNYANPDNVIIDEDGNISYQPNKDKDNYKDKNSELKFKLSYPDFLKLVLKKTDWSYECQPGLENNIVETSIKYDTNIYALLQESMQSYKGVELEFVYEYYGSPKKVVRAYNNGGRGSFIGKRFEYGSNVAGIVKNEEIINVEDDTILFVDGFEDIGIEVYYEVDFALKSLDIIDMNIGDTHYVLDRDFNPPQFKARIGKIEVSFSDRTKNKIYLANSKKIKGSTPEELENLDPDIGDGGDVGPHDHDELVYWYEYNGNGINKKYRFSVEFKGGGLLPSETESFGFGSKDRSWLLAYINWAHTKRIKNEDGIESPRYFGYNYQVRYDRGEMEEVSKINNSSDVTKQDMLNFIVNDLNIYEYKVIETHNQYNDEVDDPNAYFNKKYLGLLSEDVHTNGKTSSIGNLVSAPVVTHDTNNDGDTNANDTGSYYAYNIPALLSCLIGAFQHHVNGGEVTGSLSKDEDDYYEPTKPDPSNPSNPGGSNPGGSNPSDPSNPGDLSIYATKDFVYGYVDGEIAKAEGYMENFVLDSHNDLNALILKKEKELKELIEDIESGGSGTGGLPSDVFEVIDGKLHINLPVNFEDSANFINCGLTDGKADLSGVIELDAMTLYCANINPVLGGSGIVRIDGDLEVTGNIINSGSTGGGNDVGLYLEKNVSVVPGANQYNIMVPHSLMPTNENCDIGRPDGGASWNRLYCNYIKTDSISSLVDLSVDDLYVSRINGSSYTAGSDISLKENVRYIDTTRNIQLLNGDETTNNNEDLLEKADLYDFIVNQVSLCEFNYIGDTTNKIGFIANEYEGTKVGDKIVHSQEFKTKDREGNVIETTEHLTYDITNLLFATIGALQEEVRVRDEEINSLKSRLEAIEAKLGL